MPTKELDYVVTTACYVPVGDGFKFKQVGQVVSLPKKAANALDGYIKLVDAPAKPAAKSSKADSREAAHAEWDAKAAEVVGPPLDTPREDSDGG